MDLQDILLGEQSVIPKAEYDGQPLQERVALLPVDPSTEESSDDLATFLTAKDGLELCRRYFVSGNLAQTARELRIRYPLALRTSHESWFEEELVSLERQLKIGQKAHLDGLIGKATAELEDRLTNGDEVMTKDGIALVKVKARDLAAIAAILTERREKLDDATKPAGGAPKGKLESLADKLRANVSNATIVEPLKVGNGS